MTTTCLIGHFVGKDSALSFANAGAAGDSVIAAAATTAIALVTQECISILSLKFDWFSSSSDSRTKTHRPAFASGQPARSVVRVFCYWRVNGWSKTARGQCAVRDFYFFATGSTRIVP